MTVSELIQATQDNLAHVSLALDSVELAEAYDALSNLQFNNGKQLVVEQGIRKGQRVLDVGAGTGRLAAHVAGIVGDSALVAGIDPLPLRIELAKKRLGTRAKLVVGVAEDLSEFGNSSFDHLYLNAVYHWLPDQPAALREAVRVLKPGGRLGITTGDREHSNQVQQITEKVLRKPRFAGIPVREWLPYRVSVAIIKQQFKVAGLTPIVTTVRQYTDLFASAEEVLAFSSSSSFGNFLRELPADRASAIQADILAEIEKLRTPKGIPLERHTIFAIAEKL
jgi:arsenite methyltransferase